MDRVQLSQDCRATTGRKGLATKSPEVFDTYILERVIP